MLALVRTALHRPYTFVVLAILIFIIGPLAALRTPTDIFPDIKIPVISVVWQYTGLPPDQMAGRIVSPYERVLTTTVNDIEHMEATSYNTLSITKIFFQPNVDVRIANAQVTAISQTLLKQMPPGATPPLILNYNASTVPIIQLALSGQGLSEQMLGDLGLNVVRTPLVTVPGAAIPLPYGGKLRQIQIDLDSMLLIVDNASGELMTGAFASARFEIPASNSTINVPASALIFDQSGLRVATIDSKNRVVLKTVTISRDLGSLVEIGSGLNAGDRVVANPPDGITSGDEVRIAGEPGAKGAPDTASAKQPGG